MKKSILVLLVLFLSACSVSNNDNMIEERLSSGHLEEFYSDRSTYSLYYNIKTAYSPVAIPWYMGDAAIQYTIITTNTNWWAGGHLEIMKNGVLYAQQEDTNGRPITSTDKAFSILKVLEGADVNKFVIATTEPSPILEEDSFFLLVSKTKYSTLEAAKAMLDSPDIKIPRIEATVNPLDIVFNEGTSELDAEYKNLDAQLAKIKENFEPIEFFGYNHFTDKVKKLEDMNYHLFSTNI